MKKLFFALLLASMLLAACGPAPTPVPTQTPLPPTDTATITETPTTAPTDTPTLTPTPAYPSEGYGPTNFPTDVDPLTGLKVANPALLERRPMLIKVANLPRYVRPQWGVSLADIVFEYYTEEGTTRFAAIYLGNDAATVGPIRSGRFIDWHLVKGYKAVFALGSAYVVEMDRFLSSDFGNRLVVEGPSTPMKRFDPNGYDFLTVGTSELSAYITQKGVENGRQDLNGMFFQLQPPAAGQPALHFVAKYSGSIYNRWDYDEATGKYLRFSDDADVFSAGEAEKYVQLTDRLTNQPIAFDNVVILYAQHPQYSPGIYDISLSGTGKGFAFRDGQMVPVTWTRSTSSVVTLANADGSPYALKPGTTWFEVMGFNTNSEQTDQGWRFTHLMP